METWQSPSKISFESAFKLNQSLQINKKNANETPKAKNIPSPFLKMNTHSTSKPKKRIFPFEESKCQSQRTHKEIRTRVI